MSLRFAEYKPGVSSRLSREVVSHYRNSEAIILVNYGNGEVNVRGYDLVLNGPEGVSLAVDKPRALTHLLAEQDGSYAVPKVVPGCVLVKDRYHSGGKGHLLVDGEQKYVEQFVPCLREWRVHVVGDHTCARLKTGGTGQIRNRRHGWDFTYSENVPQPVRDAAKAAIRLLSLDFGAVDIGERRGEKPVIYEVNTAPRLQVDAVLDWYKENFIRVIDRRLRGR